MGECGYATGRGRETLEGMASHQLMGNRRHCWNYAWRVFCNSTESNQTRNRQVRKVSTYTGTTGVVRLLMSYGPGPLLWLTRAGPALTRRHCGRIEIPRPVKALFTRYFYEVVPYWSPYLLQLSAFSISNFWRALILKLHIPKCPKTPQRPNLTRGVGLMKMVIFFPFYSQCLC